MNSYTDQNQAPSEYQGNLEILMQIPFFSGMPIDAMKLIAFLCTRETFRPGDYLFQEGDVDPHAYFFIKGKAVLTLSKPGDEMVIREYSENDFLGGLSILWISKRFFSLKAITDTRCLVLERDRFQKILDQFPQIARPILEEICAFIHDWESRLIGSHAEKCPPCRSSLGLSLF